MQRRSLSLILVAVVAVSGCVPTRAQRRYTRSEANKTLSKLERVGLVIGEFPIDGANAVIDGDTIRVKGLDSSMRLLGIDTEETFKKPFEREAFARGWEQYKKEMKGDATRPVKMATPLGEDAKHWAQAFFEGVTTVRLERDHPGEIRDYYGRYLAYVFAKKNGEWVNYNIECVRAGMAPYFTKYGRSRRFDKEFREAQAQAMAQKIGIWDPNRLHYDDYEERLRWWNGRADVIARFEKEAEDNPNYITLTRWNALLQLEQHLGEEVVVLGAVNEIKLGDRGPTVVKLGRSRGHDFDVVFFDKDVALASGVLMAKGEYVRIRGTVHKYVNRYDHTEKLQLQVTLPGQVLATSPELDRLLTEDTGTSGTEITATPDSDGTVSSFSTPPPLEDDEE
ncbi:MAG: thermonuclease family protein [Myxococcaceae bacterium]|nr:thermonuclease family protein [Myxococcaceae bacterium]